jgi:heptosyltransferase-2
LSKRAHRDPGYKHIAALAETGSTRKQFAQSNTDLSPASSRRIRSYRQNWRIIFASFDLIISYLYDPDGSLKDNLRRCGVENLLCGPAKIVETGGHAARQLARPIEELGIRVVDLTEKIFLSEEDRQFGREFLQTPSQPIIAIHPGSGSKEKNWPLQNWIELFSTEHWHIEKRHSLIVISGEADKEQTAQLERIWKDREIRFAKICRCLIWPRCLSTRSSSGTTAESRTVAAAAGANCILLFGPTDPNVWAPRNENVEVLRAPNGKVNDLEIAVVQAALTKALRASSKSVNQGLRRTWKLSVLNPRSRVEISRAISMRFR